MYNLYSSVGKEEKMSEIINFNDLKIKQQTKI